MCEIDFECGGLLSEQNPNRRARIPLFGPLGSSKLPPHTASFEDLYLRFVIAQSDRYTLDFIPKAAHLSLVGRPFFTLPHLLLRAVSHAHMYGRLQRFAFRLPNLS